MIKLAKLLKLIAKRGARFNCNDDGSIAIMSTLSIAVVILVAGVAIDYSRATRVATIASAALDSAALAAAKELASGSVRNDRIEQVAQDYFMSNLGVQNVSDVTFTNFRVVRNDQTNSVGLSVDAAISTTFTAIAGFTEMNISEVSIATFNQQDIEVALMLDVSGSMRGSKIRDLRNAANDLVDILTENATDNEIRIGLAPYSTAVNAGSFARTVTNGQSNRCVHERRGAGAFADASPAGDPLGGNKRMRCARSTILPITGNINILHQNINRLRTGGWTAGHLGVAWAWYLISPEWAGIWPSASKPAAYTRTNTLKAVILMTDGSFNTEYEPGNGDSNAQARALCGNMRTKNIKVYSVAFQAPAAAEAVLRDCANNDSYYFDARNGDELRSAFREIALSLLKLRISE